MSYLGDYAEDSTGLVFKFTTRTSAGVPDTLGGTPVVSIFKANSTSSSTAGLTLTADFAGITGLNNVAVDLSSTAFYAAAQDYQAVITTGSVNGVSVVGEVVAEFSISHRYMRGTDSASTHTSTDIQDLLPSNFSTVGVSSGLLDANMQAIVDSTAGAENLSDAFNGTGGVTLSLSQLAITNTGAGACILLTGSGSGDGIDFTRTGAGEMFGTNIVSTYQDIIDGRLTAYGPSTHTSTDITDVLSSYGVSTQTSTDINDQMLDVIATDTYALLGQAAVTATPTIAQALMWLYKKSRNRMDNDGTTTQLYADDETTVDQTQATSVSSGVVTKAEWASGP